MGHTVAVPRSRDSHVTILLSTFDGERWLPTLLDSILEQTHDDWTLLVRDDGSTDGTPALISAAAAADPRIRRVDDDRGNLGPGESFMTLLGRVDDGWFAFCDQDDRWLPTKLEVSLERLRVAGVTPDRVGAVYTDATIVDEHDAPMHPSALTERGVPAGRPLPFGHLLVNNAAIGATMLGTAALAETAVRLAAGRPVLMHDWWVALVAAHSGTLERLAVPTMRWRRHPHTVTGERPPGVAGRARRRREYLRWSVDAATRLDAGGPGASAEAAAAVRALAARQDRPIGPLTMLRLWRSHGIRAWPVPRQMGLLGSVAMGRTTPIGE